MLSTEELRAWCRSKTRRGRGRYLNEHGREFATLAFIRHIGWNNEHFYQWLKGNVPIPAERARMIRRFIEDWENGWLEFTKPGMARRVNLVRRSTPKLPGVRLALDLAGPAPKLRFLGRPERNTMPAFPDVARGFDVKRK